MADKKSFIFYTSWRHLIADLAPEIRLEIYEAVSDYAETGVKPELSPIAAAVFPFIVKSIDENNERYESTSAKRSAAGKKGMESRYTDKADDNKTNKCYQRLTNDNKSNKSYQSITSVTDNDNEDDNEFSNENKKETPLTGSEETPAPAAFSPHVTDDGFDDSSAADAAGLPDDPPNPPDPGGDDAPPPGSAPPPSPRIDYVAVMNDFNARFAGKLPAVSRMTDSRRAAVRARIAECGPDSVTAVFDAIAASPFLCGANDRNWRADFDWIFRPRNYVKILENNYKGLKINGTNKRRYGDHNPADYLGQGVTDI